MKEVISNRISLIIKSLDTNATKLSKMLGYHTSVVNNVIRKRNLPSFDFIYRLKECQKNLNLNWLVSGEGNMWETDVDASIQDDTFLWKELAESLKRENILLMDKIALLESSNDDKIKTMDPEKSCKKRT